MKVRILKSCAGLNFSFSEGEVVSIKKELADELIAAGIAEEFVEKAEKKAKEKAVKEPIETVNREAELR